MRKVNRKHPPQQTAIDDYQRRAKRQRPEVDGPPLYETDPDPEQMLHPQPAPKKKKHHGRSVPYLSDWTLTRRQGYIPMWFVMHPWPSQGAKVVLQQLDGQAWDKGKMESWPSQELMANSSHGLRGAEHADERTIRRYLDELVYWGLIGKAKRKGTKQDSRAVEYRLLYKRPGFKIEDTKLRAHFVQSKRSNS